MRIALLDDDLETAAQLNAILTEAGYDCRSFHKGYALLRMLRSETVDLLLLDWNVPDFSGIEIIEWVNKHCDPKPPILLSTARTAAEDIVTGLNAGADDYLVKPVQPEILLARVKAVLRRSYPTPPSDGIEHYDDYTFDVSREQVSLGNTLIPMTSKEFTLSLLLFRNLHRPLSRGYIFETLWGRNPDLPTRTLDTHISKIRTKLNLRPENGYRLAPVYAYGYRLERLAEKKAIAAEAVR
ncbi:winged helix family two component transcriptional regulator [Zymomonas mobilis subsp. mobilis ZM4 = ATCC 31821]|uniref:Two component transcriptional regulator, winged helix family n=3 Tax=Zymomonas mobilis TaxID=542 RepID=Q5NQA3_ZYMMO|nr:response regulator transcription factor [Zymomonas mobilis]AAV89102.1 two component transcriptional regulator, winged helix family [Zymomonas mobilis subsp. mobilis ZM4 = ATCC 31821]ACV75323.1 two component transcriptional regulator, winged helix family [Zymomonas mobilis subsp. mobilis NCIMB 11163]AEH62840.1 two component transcriptional regulator, winged helix family [Zymomonas mobilis subsp. mobilis ATCC 10988]AFN56681.1 two component transcriptional regulator, winged helix family [Zymomo